MAHTFEARVGLDKFPIIIGQNIFQELKAFIKTYDRNNIFIICDSYFKNLEDSKIKELKFIEEYNLIFVDGGIESKTIETFKEILKVLVHKNIARDGLIVSIGGGVIGDLGAFVSSTYQRGVNLVHVPTTTTAMIDSSIGGKTGLNHLDQVNLIGTFYNPKAIFMDLRFLETLNNRDYFAGICEAIKMSITSDKEMFEKFFEINKFLKNRDSKKLEEVIYWSVITKLKHVSCDFKEKSLRLTLNYGHTFGQAIETYYGLYQDKLKHGEAVSLGIVVAANFSNLIFNNKSSDILLRKTKEILTKYYLPRQFKDLNTTDFPDIRNIVQNLSNDKKRLSKGNRFILCEKIGKSIIKTVKDARLINESFSCLY